MSALGRLLGTWEIMTHHSAIPEPVTGRQRYERVLDRAFMLQHWNQESARTSDSVEPLLLAREGHSDFGFLLPHLF